MIIFISPAKSLDFENNITIGTTSLPYFLEDAVKVNSSLKRKSRKALIELQGVSRQLAELNFHRNQNWLNDDTETAQAVMAFKGDVYQGMEADQWDESDMEFASSKLRILSGLYGVLRPGDLIKPYRLEMGTRLKIGRREDLYKFWADKVKQYFKDNIGSDRLVVNLASNEYFKAVISAKVANPILNVDFKDFKNGDYKVISFFAKKARGMMANYIVKNRITDKEKIKEFDSSGYYFDAKTSNQDHYIFLRDKQENEKEE